jgi:hypothetical protein
LNTSRPRCRPSGAVAAQLVLACAGSLAALSAAAEDPQPAEPVKTLPQSGLMSSLKQAVKQGYDHEAVRGYFDLGPPANHHRYYCLVDLKTGQLEPNGVLGQPTPLPSGMTGLKADSVSLYLCADAQREGMLVTEGFVLSGTAAGANSTAAAAAAKAAALAAAAPSGAPAAPASAPAAAPLPSPAAPAPAPAVPAPPPESAAGAAGFGGSNQVDVAGLRLGMSLDEVRAVLKFKRLREYRESAETLSSLPRTGGAVQPLANGRFVNIIAAWSAPPLPAPENFQSDGESYEVMFTPVPGHERAMAIVHSVGYAPANALRETVLDGALAKKYGGFAAGAVLPQAPTWRLQAAGGVATGDACGRRATFGGLSGLSAGAARDNVALKLGADELRFQIEHCGAAIVTEDHFTPNGGALRDDRIVTRFTVTAFSPTLALDGAKAAAQQIGADRGASPASKAPAAPEL